MLATLMTFCAFAAQADVIELNANAGFDHDLQGVTVLGAPSGGSVAWTPNDVDGTPGSGALELTGPPGRYKLKLCLRPGDALGWQRRVFEFSARVQGTSPAWVQSEGIFAINGDHPTDLPCEGPWFAYLMSGGTATVHAPARLASAIPTTPWPLLQALLIIDKQDAGAVVIDDWSISVDTDVIFRDDDPSSVVFSL